MIFFFIFTALQYKQTSALKIIIIFYFDFFLM